MKEIHPLIYVIILSIFACNSENKKQGIDPTLNTIAFDMQKAKTFIDSINAKF